MNREAYILFPGLSFTIYELPCSFSDKFVMGGSSLTQTHPLRIGFTVRTKI